MQYLAGVLAFKETAKDLDRQSLCPPKDTGVIKNKNKVFTRVSFISWNGLLAKLLHSLFFYSYCKLSLIHNPLNPQISALYFKIGSDKGRGRMSRLAHY